MKLVHHRFRERDETAFILERTLIGANEYMPPETSISSGVMEQDDERWFRVSKLAAILLKGVFIIVALVRAVRIVKRERIELICAEEILTSGVVCRLLHMLFSIPYCIQMHAWSDECSADRTAEAYAKFTVRRLVLRGACLVACTSDEAVPCLRRLGVSEDQVAEVPLGISLGRFKPDSEAGRKTREQWVVGKNSIVLGYVGRLSSEKNVLATVKVFEELCRIPAINSAAIHLVLIGTGEEERGIRNYIEKHDIKNCHLLGQTRYPELVYSAFDLYISLSKHETFALSVAESLACGVPAIVSKLRAHEKLVNDGENGLVIRKGTIRSAAQAIAELIGNPSVIHKMSRNATKSVQGLDSVRSIDRLIETMKKCAKVRT